MKKKSVILNKTYIFSLKIIKLSRDLIGEKEFVISKQLLRCGTGIGANVEEGNGAQSRRDFRAKIFIAYKEARETRYWLRLLRDSKMIPLKTAEKLLDEIEEICRILGKILSSSKK